MKVAALDLGSNTFLLLICEVERGKITKVYQDEIEVTKLGQGVHADRLFHPEALIRAEECLKKYSSIIKSENPDKILAVATSAARDVKNSEILFQIGNKYDIPIEIIPGHLEAQITFEGATYDLPSKNNLAVIDVGGGSTEIIAMNEAGDLQGVSVDVGSVRLTEMFVSGHPVPDGEIEKMIVYATEQFGKVRNQLPKMHLRQSIGVAGTPTTLAAVMQERQYSDNLVHGYEISTNDIQHWLKKLAKLDLEARKKLVGMDPARADVMIAGLAILYCANKALGMNELQVSTRGVRNGVALYAAKGAL